MDLDEREWSDRLTELAREHRVPGASLAVVSDGAVFSATTGVLNTETGVEATTDSLFQIGSITKPFTATVVLALADAGEIDLDAPVAASIPDFRVGDPEVTRGVTARHLLTHTSGIAGDFFPDVGRGDDVLRRLLAACGDLTQDVPMGTIMSYSNTGFSILGRLIECVTGDVWDVAMREHLFAPLGLSRAATLPEHALRGRVAVGHLGDDDGAPAPTRIWALPRSVGPAGTICATAEELITFAQVHLDGGRARDGRAILSESAAGEMRRPQVDVPDPWSTCDHWGLGWGIFDREGQALIGHDGSSIGQLAFLRLAPEAGAAVALLTNGGDADALGKELVGSLMHELCGVTDPTPPEPSRDPRVAADVPGTYERRGARLVIDLDEADRAVATMTFTEPLGSLLPPPPPSDLVLLPSTAGEYVYVGRDDPEGEWEPFVFLEVDGERYVHNGARAMRRRR